MSLFVPTSPVSNAVHLIGKSANEIQPFGSMTPIPIAFAERIRREAVTNLNQLLADAVTLRDLYVQQHLQALEPTFHQLHLLFDKHAGEQSVLIDEIAERVVKLGGLSVAMSADVAEKSLIPLPPKGREKVPIEISRLLHAHAVVLKEARVMARLAAQASDDGTNDMLVSDVIRTNETQVWFFVEHLVDSPFVRADAE